MTTDPHTDGGQTPAGPVHHVEEEETRHRDEVGVCSERKTNGTMSLVKVSLSASM